MQFDRIDQSFLNHASSLERNDGLQADRSDCEPRLTTTVERPDIESAHGVACSQKERISDSSQTEMSEEVVPDKVLGMLLAAVPEQWEALADQVVGACAKGHRVIGIAGHRAQEGRTTIARGTADVLRSRGRKVRYVGSSQELCANLLVARICGPSVKTKMVVVSYMMKRMLFLWIQESGLHPAHSGNRT